MKRIKSGFILLTAGLILFSCIKEIEVFKGSDPTFVIDGLITNEPGPQIVKMSISRSYNERPDYFMVEQAIVKIIDDLGNEETLTYAGDGAYASSPDFTGVIGRSYHLDVTMKTGEQYSSAPETLLPVVEIENLRFQKQGTSITYYLDLQDNGEVQNFYSWRYKGTYEFVAPEAYKARFSDKPMKNSFCISWPTPTYARDVWQCWVSDFDNEFLKIENDALFNGRLMTVPLFSMDLTRKFDRGYSLEVKQYSMTRRAYKYWKGIEDQIGNSGTIFETNNYQIRGNIHSLDNEEELILGYFGASAVSSKRLFVLDYIGQFGDVPCEENNSGCFPERCMDCRKFSGSATTAKPDFWYN